MKHVILYEYEWYDAGCGCCTESTSEVFVYDIDRLDKLDGVYTAQFNAPLLENESELREYIAEHHPEYNGFILHEGNQWF